MDLTNFLIGFSTNFVFKDILIASSCKVLKFKNQFLLKMALIKDDH